MGTRSARATAPRLYPAGRSIALLGVCAPELVGRKLTIEGRKVQTVAYQRLALLVAFLEPGEETARLAEQAIERCEPHGTVLPVKPGTVFADPAALEGAAVESHARWSRALTRLGTKREVAVHVYAGPHLPPGGMPYVARVTARASRSGRAPALRGEERVVEHAGKLFRACADAAIATRRVRPYPQRHALWSATFLVEPDEVARFENLIEGFVEAGAAIGVTAHVEEARPPFSFV